MPGIRLNLDITEKSSKNSHGAHADDETAAMLASATSRAKPATEGPSLGAVLLAVGVIVAALVVWASFR